MRRNPAKISTFYNFIWGRRYLLIFVKKERQEKQRYGRDKSTVIDHTYINSGEYRNKFDTISDNKELNRLLYNLAKKMLNHRSGTQYEDMYWIDIDTLEIVAAETNQKKKGVIKYSKRTKKAIKGRRRLIAIHTHPNSMPPSVADINSAVIHKYEQGIICCHNGKIYSYQAHGYMSEYFYGSTVEKYKKIGYDEVNSRLLALSDYAKKGLVSNEEVVG